MTTPLQVFLHEMHLLGFALVRGPGGYGAGECYCDWHAKVVSIGRDMDDVTAGIVGLHELGHYHSKTELCPAFILRHAVPYVEELNAWLWAASKMPPGYDHEFQVMRAFGLNSYRPKDVV